MSDTSTLAPLVMVVDDTPANLRLLAEMLEGEGYRAGVFPRGRQALAAAYSEPPDAILLDINMPELNGFQVCGALKAEPLTAAIPVLFLSARCQVADKIEAFAVGGVDYITKPFQAEEVCVRVATHLELGRLRRSLEAAHGQLQNNYDHLQRLSEFEQELLEDTLNGCVKLLSDVLALSNPAGFGLAPRVARVVRALCQSLEIAGNWEIELAASLSQLGCVSLPPDILARAIRGKPLSPAEQELYDRHPRVGYELLVNIPRLEGVAELVLHQGRRYADGHHQIPLGARMLRLAVDYVILADTGLSSEVAIAQLATREGLYDPELLSALPAAVIADADAQVIRVSAVELVAGMRLAADVWSPGGQLLMAGGTVLNASLAARLVALAALGRVLEPLSVAQ